MPQSNFPMVTASRIIHCVIHGKSLNWFTKYKNEFTLSTLIQQPSEKINHWLPENLWDVQQRSLLKAKILFGFCSTTG